MSIQIQYLLFAYFPRMPQKSISHISMSMEFAKYPACLTAQTYPPTSTRVCVLFNSAIEIFNYNGLFIYPIECERFEPNWSCRVGFILQSQELIVMAALWVGFGYLESWLDCMPLLSRTLVTMAGIMLVPKAESRRAPNPQLTRSISISLWSAGEYSASAIKSGSVSWRALIGCHGYLHWRSVTALLTLLWIIKFALARDICQPGANRAAIVKATVAARTWKTGSGGAREGGPKSKAGSVRVSGSISATKVAEDKTWVVPVLASDNLDFTL